MADPFFSISKIINVTSNLIDFNGLEFVTVLAKYNRKEIKILDDEEQTKIARSIIMDLFTDNYNLSLKSSDFEAIAHAICEVFPSEIPSIYYLAKGQGRRPKGKLYNSYNRWKTVLRVSGLSIAPPNEPPSPEYCAAIKCENDDDKDDVQNSALEFLEQQLHPPDEMWRGTYAVRKQILENQDFATTDYFRRFPCLSGDDGLKYLCDDADIMHPQLKNVAEIKEKIIFIAKKLIILAKLKKINELKIFLEILGAIEDYTSEHIAIVGLLTLPFFFAVTSLSAKQPKRKKTDPVQFVTKSEAKQSFVGQFNTIEDYDKEINYVASSRSVQPRFAIIGDISNDQYAIQIADKRFVASGIIDGFIGTFKVICALNCEYPLAANIPWTFVEQAMFGCTTNVDINSPYFKGLLNNLNAITTAHIEKFDYTFSPTTYLKE